MNEPSLPHDGNPDRASNMQSDGQTESQECLGIASCSPEPYRPLLISRAGSAFGTFRSFARRGRQTDVDRSAFCPVGPNHSAPSSWNWAVGVSSTEGTVVELEASETTTATTITTVASQEQKAASSKTSTMSSKLLSNLKGVIKKKKSSRSTTTKRRSGRENPATPALVEEDDGEDSGASDNAATSIKNLSLNMTGDRDKHVNRSGLPLHGPTLTAANEEQRSDDPGVALSMSSDTDIDEDKAIEPIVGQYHLLEEEKHPRPPSLESPGVEVVSLESNVIANSSYRSFVTALHNDQEPTFLSHDTDKNQKSSESSEYHIFLDENESDCTDVQPDRDVHAPNVDFPLHLNFESPKPATFHTSPSSHDSRHSSLHSLKTANFRGNISIHTDSSFVDADHEVRLANQRKSSSHRQHEDVIVDFDGNATVHSSSTSSSNYHVYGNSPQSLREGATMPVDRFFAGGNVVLTPKSIGSLNGGGDREDFSGETISLSRKVRRDATHSPHTVSSASVSNTSSSGSDTKEPLKFVTYPMKVKESHSRKHIVDCSRLTFKDKSRGKEEDIDASHPQTRALIQPRISKGIDERPPLQHHHITYQRPPQSPRKADWARGNELQTPTGTPPPTSRETPDGATTPSSPPIIVDGPNALRGDLNNREGTTKPNVVRSSSLIAASSVSMKTEGESSSGKLFLLPAPSGRFLHDPRHQSKESSFSSRGISSEIGEGAGTECFRKNAIGVSSVSSPIPMALISPEKSNSTMQFIGRGIAHQNYNLKSHSLKGDEKNQDSTLTKVAVVSPEKGV